MIATNGKAPFNNKEVEVISKIDKFDPKGFNFKNKNNWVNQTAESRVLDTSPQPKRRQNKDIASASVTATTVFQGLYQNS